MHMMEQIRRWRGGGSWSLFILAVPLLCLGQTETSNPAAKPAPAATAQTGEGKTQAGAAKGQTGGAKASASGHAATKSASPHESSSAQRRKNSRGKKVSKRVAKKRGQQAIDSTRAREIQEALIREHYMEGEPTGSWDSTTQAAMQRYQEDQGWQSKTTPDARALIKLGLGPSNDHLLNPESAMTTAPAGGDPKAAAKPTPAQNNIPQQ